MNKNMNTKKHVGRDWGIAATVVIVVIVAVTVGVLVHQRRRGGCARDDQCPMGAYCDKRSCVDGCTIDDDCGDLQTCDLVERTCHGITCDEDAQCPEKQECVDNTWYDPAGDLGPSVCMGAPASQPAPAPVPDGPCKKNKDCKAVDAPACANGKCVECLKDVDCEAGRCNTSTFTCVACVGDGDCPLGNVCSGNTCKPGGLALNAGQLDRAYPLKLTEESDYRYFENYPAPDNASFVGPKKHYFNKKGQCGKSCDSSGGLKGSGSWHKIGQDGCTDRGMISSFNNCQYMEKNFDGNKEKCCTAHPDIMTSDGKIDASKCMGGWRGDYWMPWTPSCNHSAGVKAYCSRSDETTGTSNLIADRNCRDWCTQNGTACDSIIRQYCIDNPAAPECACLMYKESGFYKSFATQLKSTVTSDTLGISLENPVCWVPACAGTNLVDVLRTSEVQDTFLHGCEGQDINICQQVINVSDSTQIAIDNVTWNQTCPDAPNPSSACEPGCENGNACSYDRCVCGKGYGCTGAAQCDAGSSQCKTPGCGATTCTNNNVCKNDVCVCGSGAACYGSESCQDGKCVPQCAPSCQPGENCAGGVCMCGGGPGCGAGKTCRDGLCVKNCGRCTNNNTCNFSTGECECGAFTENACFGRQVCQQGTGLCASV
jgi:hypothetical protein